MDKLIHGSDGGSQVSSPDGGSKVKVYKHPGSSYILCHDEDNAEYIFKLQDETIQDGIFRMRWDGRKTEIGSQYFRRSGREVDRIYFLCRDNESGNIEYYDIIDARELAWYSFNPETLEWTNLDE